MTTETDGMTPRITNDHKMITKLQCSLKHESETKVKTSKN